MVKVVEIHMWSRHPHAAHAQRKHERVQATPAAKPHPLPVHPVEPRGPGRSGGAQPPPPSFPSAEAKAGALAILTARTLRHPTPTCRRMYSKWVAVWGKLKTLRGETGVEARSIPRDRQAPLQD